MSTGNNLDQFLNDRQTPESQWLPPIFYDLSSGEDQQNLIQAFEEGKVDKVVDPIEPIAEDLYEFHFPDCKQDNVARQEYIDEVLSRGKQFGTWVLFPWSGELVRYPELADHRNLRTSRNRQLINTAEQNLLYESAVAVFGLSVGSNVVGSLALSGVGGKLIMADMDVVSPSNLNRIHGSITDVGAHKIDVMAKRLSQIDPWINQVHLRNGATTDNIESLVEHQPQVIIDEIDDLVMKSVLRDFARRHNIAVLMATDVDDTVVLDVERYDTEDIDLFNGRLDESNLAALQNGNLDPEQRQQIMLKLVGEANLSPRLIESFFSVGQTLPGIPQLGTTATIGGAVAAVASREIILNRELPSGRHTLSAKPA